MFSEVNPERANRPETEFQLGVTSENLFDNHSFIKDGKCSRLRLNAIFTALPV